MIQIEIFVSLYLYLSFASWLGVRVKESVKFINISSLDFAVFIASDKMCQHGQSVYISVI